MNAINTELAVAAKKRILVVDDSFIMRKLVKDVVESDEDLQVVDTAEDGKIALQKVRDAKPDLVLLDIEMPEMSGLETLRRLGLRSRCKVVILSSLGQQGSAESVEALRLGAAAVLAKPSGSVSLDLKAARGSEIIRTIRGVLDLPPLEAEAPATDAADQPAAETPAAPGPAAPSALQTLLLSSLDTGVLAFDQAGRVTVANGAAGRLLGQSAIEPGKTTLEELFNDYNEGLGADIRGVLATGEAMAPTATECARPDGEWQPVRLSASPLPDASGKTGAMVLLDDMSREKEIKKLLARTLSEDVATKLLAGGKLDLGGSIERASILFCDVRSFTSLSETLGAAGIVALLNEYFSFMEDILKSHGGVIDKYIGDAIMALFGVPAKLGNDADRAVKGGLGMVAALDLLNQEREARGQPAIKIGIGIATGEVIAGNIGSPSRMNYTVIGDAVNLASRIESLTKQYGAELMICGETFQALKEPVPSRKVDLVRVKGQAAATTLYEVYRAPKLADPNGWLQAYSGGFEAYVAGNWEQARQGLEVAARLHPGDKAAKLLVERCQTLLAEKPADWDGVWTHHEK